MGGVYLRKHTITPSPLSMFAPNPIFHSRLSHKTRLLRRWRHEAIALYSLLLYLIGWPLSDDQWQPIAAILYRTFSVKSTNFVELLVFNLKPQFCYDECVVRARWLSKNFTWILKTTNSFQIFGIFGYILEEDFFLFKKAYILTP